MRHLATMLAALLVAGAPFSGAADPFGEIASFSSIKRTAVGDLASGDIAAERGSSGHFDRGLSVQSCYLVRRPSEATAELLSHWNPSRHRELNIHASNVFESNQADGLETLRLDPSIESVRRLLEETHRALEDTPRVNLSSRELQHLRRSAEAAGADEMDAESPEFARFAQRFWTGLLAQRLQAFKGGGIAAVPPYDIEGTPIPIHGELLTLVDEEPAVKQRFDGFLHEVLVHPPGQEPPRPVSCYWQLSDSEKTASFCLGVIYARRESDHWKMADYQIYSSSSYLTMITLYELWPVRQGGSDCTLVWRQDFVSSSNFASLRGVEQMAAGALMTKSLKQNIRIFQEDAVSPQLHDAAPPARSEP